MENSSLTMRILEWAEAHPEFDTKFVESCHEQLLRRGSLSPKQMSALSNIAEKFNIEEWEDAQI